MDVQGGRSGAGSMRLAQARALAALVAVVALVAVSLLAQPRPPDGGGAAAIRSPGEFPGGQALVGRGDPPAAGKLLVAARGLPDSHFARALVLLLDHNSEGAMGLVVNEPTEFPLARIFKGLPIAGGEAATAFAGGPVQAQGVTALIRSAASIEGARRVVGEIHLVRSGALMTRWLANDSDRARVRVFLGYSGWGPGQVESEWRAGVWHVLDADADAVFDPEPGDAWERQVRRTGWQRASRHSGSGRTSMPAIGSEWLEKRETHPTPLIAPAPAASPRAAGSSARRAGAAREAARRGRPPGSGAPRRC
jgi:putative transcriptional regulator